MSRIVVDAGATKTEFVVLNDGDIVCRYVGRGINPNYCSEADMLQTFADFVSHCPSMLVEEVYYYGAGCASLHNQQMLQELIGRFFPLACVAVYSDLLAVCHAVSRNKRSVVAILGTGAASCLFDGQTILHRAPSLGYMLGDEGSGTNLGKRLLTTYLRQELPATLSCELEKKCALSQESVICRVYREQNPNNFMSSLAPFVHEHLQDAFIHDLAVSSFEDFFMFQKKHYPDSECLEWNFSGSVAFHFRDVVAEAATRQHCRCGSFIAAPMELLVDYYKSI